MRELLPYLRLIVGYRGRLLLGAVLLLATTVAAVGLLGLAGWFITATAVTAALWSAGAAATLDIYVPGAGIRFFALARTVSRYLERLYNHDTVLRLLAALRRDVFAALTRLDAGTLQRLRSAQLLNRLTADIDALDALYLRVLAPPLVALLAVMGLGLVLGLIAPQLAVVGALGLVLASVFVVIVAGRCGAPAADRQATLTEQLRVDVVETVDGLAEHLVYATMDAQRTRIRARDAALARLQRRVDRVVAGGEAAVEWAVQVAGVAVLLTGIAIAPEQGLSGAVVVFAGLAVLGLGEVLAGLPGAFVQLGRSRAAARRLNAQTSLTAGVRQPANPEQPGAVAAVRLEAVHFRYAPTHPAVLEGVDLHVAPGERIAILGPSGCGKSTLAALLVRWIDPLAGTVRFGGTDLRRLDLEALRRRIGYLTQATELFDDTVAGNLRIAAPQADEDALWAALWTAGLASFVATLPAGLDTLVGESGGRLSGGQARRLALARVVLLNPDVVVLDEPFRGMDADTAATVSAGMDAWLDGRSVMMLGHDAAALPGLSRTLTLEAGRLRSLPPRASN